MMEKEMGAQGRRMHFRSPAARMEEWTHGWGPFISASKAFIFYFLFFFPLFSGYVGDVLGDAHKFAELRVDSEAGKTLTLNREDVRLAVQSRVDFCCAGPPPREVPQRGKKTEKRDKRKKKKKEEKTRRGERVKQIKKRKESTKYSVVDG